MGIIVNVESYWSCVQKGVQFFIIVNFLLYRTISKTTIYNQTFRHMCILGENLCGWMPNCFVMTLFIHYIISFLTASCLTSLYSNPNLIPVPSTWIDQRSTCAWPLTQPPLTYLPWPTLAPTWTRCCWGVPRVLCNSGTSRPSKSILDILNFFCRLQGPTTWLINLCVQDASLGSVTETVTLSCFNVFHLGSQCSQPASHRLHSPRVFVLLYRFAVK